MSLVSLQSRQGYLQQSLQSREFELSLIRQVSLIGLQSCQWYLQPNLQLHGFDVRLVKQIEPCRTSESHRFAESSRVSIHDQLQLCGFDRLGVSPARRAKSLIEQVYKVIKDSKSGWFPSMVD